MKDAKVESAIHSDSFVSGERRRASGIEPALLFARATISLHFMCTCSRRQLFDDGTIFCSVTQLCSPYLPLTPSSVTRAG